MKRSATRSQDVNNHTDDAIKNEVRTKAKIKQPKKETDAYPEELEEFINIDLRVKPRPFRRKNKDS